MATVNKESVRAAVEQLKEQGLSATNKAIRGVLGVGSFSSIGLIVKELGIERKPQPKIESLPEQVESKFNEFKMAVAAELTNIINQEREAAAAAATELESNYLSVLNESEGQLEEITNLNELLTAEREEKDKATGQIKQLTIELKAAQAELKDRATAVEKTAIELGKLQGQNEIIATLKEQLKDQITRNDQLQQQFLKLLGKEKPDLITSKNKN